MRVFITLFAFALLSACAASQSPALNDILVPPPLEFDSYSYEHQTEMAARRAAALKEASQSKNEVTRAFNVREEYHRGIFFTPLGSGAGAYGLPFVIVDPDFANETIGDAFYTQFRDEVQAQHMNQMLLCECTGVEWSFYGGDRFIVRKARLYWEYPSKKIRASPLGPPFKP